jgi:hypothetical protein
MSRILSAGDHNLDVMANAIGDGEYVVRNFIKAVCVRVSFTIDVKYAVTGRGSFIRWAHCTGTMRLR